jgi:hypothetical protein
LIELTGCRFEVCFNATDDLKDIWALRGFNEEANRIYWPSPVISYEIDELDVVITTKSGSLYKLKGVSYDNSFIQDLNDVIENGGWQVL